LGNATTTGEDNNVSNYDNANPEDTADNGIENGVPAEIPDHLSITGIIVSIEDDNGTVTYIIEDEHGNPAHLVTSEDTEFIYHWLVRRGAGVGDTVTGWYSAYGIMPMIWPPQYNITRLDIQETPEA